MDELSALRAFRSDVPGPTDETRNAARARVVAQRRGARASIAAVSFAVVAAAVIVTAALGVGPLGFVAGDPAPPRVQAEVSLRNAVQAAARSHGETVDVDELRLLLSLDTRAGAVHVWTVPLKSGQRCTYVHVAERRLASGRPDVGRGPCTNDGGIPLYGRYREIRAQGRTTGVVEGWVRSDAAHVELRLEPRGVRPITPVDGFFFVEIPADAVDAEIVAERSDGSPLRYRGAAVEPTGIAVSLPVPPEQIGPAETVVEIQHSAGFPASLISAPGEDGTRCVYLKWRGTTGGGCHNYDDTPFTVSTTQIGAEPRAAHFLDGYAPPGIAAVEVVYEDGVRERARLAEGLFLHEPREGVPVAAVLGLDEAGREVARKRVP